MTFKDHEWMNTSHAVNQTLLNRSPSPFTGTWTFMYHTNESYAMREKTSAICCSLPLHDWGPSLSGILSGRQSTNHWVVFHHQPLVCSTPALCGEGGRKGGRESRRRRAVDRCHVTVTEIVWTAEKVNIGLVFLSQNEIVVWKYLVEPYKEFQRSFWLSKSSLFWLNDLFVDWSLHVEHAIKTAIENK